MEKALNNTNVKDVKKTTSDLEVFGDGDLFKLISKASSKSQGWMKSTKAMQAGDGCVVQVTTEITNPDGTKSVAEALTYVPNVLIINVEEKGKVVGRELVSFDMESVKSFVSRNSEK